MRASRKKQAELFAALPHRYVQAEPMRFYEAVVFLRAKGSTVLRVSDRQSLVDGCLLDNRQLLQLADQLESKLKWT